MVALPRSHGAAVYHAADTRKGCPAKAKANGKLLRLKFTVPTRQTDSDLDWFVIIAGHMSAKSTSQTILQLLTCSGSASACSRTGNIRATAVSQAGDDLGC